MKGFHCKGLEGHEEPTKSSVWPWCVLPGGSKKLYLQELETGIQWAKTYMYGKRKSKGLNFCEREERDMTKEFGNGKETAQPTWLRIFGHSKNVPLEITCIWMVLLDIQCDVETQHLLWTQWFAQVSKAVNSVCYWAGRLNHQTLEHARLQLAKALKDSSVFPSFSSCPLTKTGENSTEIL